MQAASSIKTGSGGRLPYASERTCATVHVKARHTWGKRGLRLHEETARMRRAISRAHQGCAGDTDADTSNGRNVKPAKLASAETRHAPHPSPAKTERQASRRVAGQTDGQTDTWADRQMDAWGQTNAFLHLTKPHSQQEPRGARHEHRTHTRRHTYESSREEDTDQGKMPSDSGFSEQRMRE